MTTIATPSGRPHWLDDSPEATAFRRAELMSAVKGFDSGWKHTERERRARSRAAWLESRIEELLDQVDRLRAELAGTAGSVKGRKDYVIAELEHVGGARSLEDMADALGYDTADDLKRSLARWGRMDLAGVAA